MALEITPSILQAALGISPVAAFSWAPAISHACAEAMIDTSLRAAAFLAQAGHESGGFSELVENLNYDAHGLLEEFPTHFTADEAAAYSRQPEKIANRVYANRMGNGDEASGDGWKYRGHGILQLTGKADFAACGIALDLDLLAQPDLLLQKVPAARSATWEWGRSGLNELADVGNFMRITHIINGGYNGSADRLMLYGMAKKALGIA
jgi:putative chitinase